MSNNSRNSSGLDSEMELGNKKKVKKDVEDGGDHRAALLVLGALGDDGLPVLNQGVGLDGVGRLLHRGRQGGGVGSRLRGDVELVVAGVGSHRLELVGGGVDRSDPLHLGVGTGGDDADDRGCAVRSLGVVIGVVRGEADRVADAEALLLGQ